MTPKQLAALMADDRWVEVGIETQRIEPITGAPDGGNQ